MEGSSPKFQFFERTGRILSKNYPAFYDLVKNILPNILKDPNYLKALMDVTGMSEETLKKAFTYGDGPTLHANSIWSDGLYDYSGSHAKEGSCIKFSDDKFPEINLLNFNNN